MKDNSLAKLIRYLIYATAFVPLVIFSQFLSPFHFGKVVIFRSIVEIMLVLYLLLIWQNRSYWSRWNMITWAFLFFTAAFTLTTFTSINVYQSFWGTLERMGGLWSFWHYFVYYIILTSVIRTKSDWAKLLKIMVAVGILSAFYGFGQKTDIDFFIGSGNRARIFGTMGNTALFAGYQMLILFLSLTLLLKGNNTKNEKFLYYLSAAVTTIAILMTAVRGSLLALGLGSVLFFVLYALAFRSRWGKKMSLALVSLFILFILFALAFGDSGFVKNSRYLTRLTDFSLKSYTVQTRFWAWQAGINGWDDSVKTLVFGWGPENFNIPFSLHFNPKFYEGPGSETLFDRAHNMFVEVLVTMGILGLATYLWMFATIFLALKKIITKSSDKILYGIGFIPLVTAYIIHNSFIFDTSANFITFFTILGFIKFLSSEDDYPPEKVASAKKPSPAIFQTVAFLLLLIVVVVIYKTNIIPAKANYATTRGIIKGWEKNFGGSVEKYKEALKYETFGKYEIRHRFAQYVLDFVSSGKINKEREEILKYVIKEVEKNEAENKLDYLPHLYLSRLYIVLGKDDPKSEYNDMALKYSKNALDISPTFVRTYFEVAQAYLNKKDFASASEWFDKASKLSPNVGVAYWYWGVTEFERGDIRSAVEKITKAVENRYYLNEDEANRAISIYLKVNDYKGMIPVLRQLIYLKPDDPHYRASLATAYAQTGQLDKAVEQAREAVRIDPSFESEARAFARSLGRDL